MNLKSEILEISNDKDTCNKNKVNLSYFYVFGIGSSINWKHDASFDTRSDALYKIRFAIDEAGSISGYSILSFSKLNQKPMIFDNDIAYEAYFTKDILSKGTLTLSEKLGLFKSQLPMRLLVNKNQEWRINEIFKSMADESTATYSGRNEMIRTLIHELILFTQRLVQESPHELFH